MFKIEYLIYIYMTLCVCMMVFNIIYMIFTVSTEKNKKKSKNAIIKKINAQINLLESGLRVGIRHKEYVYKKLKRTYNLLLFEYALDLQDEDKVEKYIKEIQIIFDDLAIYYEKADGIKKAYFAYIIDKYRIIENAKSNILINTMYQFLEEDSIYCRDNSFKAIINSGNIEYIIEALKILNKLEYYYYPDIIFKGLVQFKGKPEELENKLWKEFEKFNIEIRIAIVRYANKLKLDYKEEFCKTAIKEDIEEEVKIEIIKYFGENYYELAQNLLIEFTKEKGIKNKKIIIESAKALRKYNNQDTKEALKMLMKRNDWEIKEAASETLTAISTSYYELADIYNGEDETARRILKYKMQNYKAKYKNVEAEVG